MDPSQPAGDSCCPSCGGLLWWLRDRLSVSSLDFDSTLADIDAESLDMVELVMELEEEFDVNVSEKDAAEILTVRDVIRLIRRFRTDDAT